MLKKSTKPKTIKNVPWRGWKDVKPTTHGRTVMAKKCGKKCFLGPKKSFPICDMNTCDVDRRGVYAAYVRAKEWETRSKRLNRSPSKYRKVSRKAKMLLDSKMLKGAGFGIFDNKTEIEKSIDVSDSTDIKDFSEKMRNYIKSFLNPEGTRKYNNKNIGDLSKEVTEYLKKYKLDSNNCGDRNNEKVLNFMMILNNESKKIDGEDDRSIIYMAKKTLRDLLQQDKDNLKKEYNIELDELKDILSFKNVCSLKNK
jgi:hypothetical protein